jgi:hypothetical protein
MNAGPCLCGAVDCPRCYAQPIAEDRDDEREDRRDADRDDFLLARAENRRDSWRD